MTIIRDAYTGYWNYLLSEILHPSWHNYFYWLIGISLAVWLLEILLPWRKDQAIVRKDFWLDGFYMFFNFFIFSLIGYNALSHIGTALFNDFLALFGIDNLVAIEAGNLPFWVRLLIMFVIADFIQWNIHRLLHRVPTLWEFHKVHHSVEQMGFAAHLRFHFAETIIYKTLQYIPLAMLGFGLTDFFIVHIITIIIGHINHANLSVTYGRLRYILNNPVMHIWHHARQLPPDYPYGVNFGLSLSIWDYLFGTAYIPRDGRDLDIGVDNPKPFPATFWQQLLYPFRRLSGKA